MATVELTAETFEDTVGGNDIVFVDFWASWCGPCRVFAPVFEQAASKHPDIVFGKVDTEAEVALATAAQITSIPTHPYGVQGRIAGVLPARRTAAGRAGADHRRRPRPRRREGSC